MRLMYNVKNRYAIFLKLRVKFLTFVTKLVLKANTSICSTVKENLLLYCHKILEFSAAVIVAAHIFLEQDL